VITLAIVFRTLCSLIKLDIKMPIIRSELHGQDARSTCQQNPGINNNNNNNNNYDNLYGAVTRPYRYKGALQATTLGRP